MKSYYYVNSSSNGRGFIRISEDYYTNLAIHYAHYFHEGLYSFSDKTTRLSNNRIERLYSFTNVETGFNIILKAIKHFD